VCKRDLRLCTKASPAHIAIFPLHNHTLEIAFLDEFKELQRAAIDMTHKTDAGRFTRNDRAENFLALNQRQPAEIAPVQPENVEAVSKRPGSLVFIKS
jgi:hypothetical protein